MYLYYRDYYRNILVTDFTTNGSMTIDEVLELIEFDEDEFRLAEGVMDELDPNNFYFTTEEEQP